MPSTLAGTMHVPTAIDRPITGSTRLQPLESADGHPSTLLRAYPGRDLLVGLEDRLVGVYRGGYCGSCVEG